MKTIVISDLHLGSKFCRYSQLLNFIRNLPPDCNLVLNGDTVDRWQSRFHEEHSPALELLVAESFKRQVVWVQGNHDKRFVLRNKGMIEFKPSHCLGNQLFISHGYDFDGVMPLGKAFIFVFRYMHHLRIRFGAEAMHVAFYAKRFRRLYEVLRTNIRTNATRYAQERGFGAVTCGHTHYAEDIMVDGIRYINTGAWTEEPIFYLDVTENDMKLVKFMG
jgi:UDP-2,3-diacylglucosamine pyrophosphatase LpxH